MFHNKQLLWSVKTVIHNIESSGRSFYSETLSVAVPTVGQRGAGSQSLYTPDKLHTEPASLGRPMNPPLPPPCSTVRSYPPPIAHGSSLLLTAGCWEGEKGLAWKGAHTRGFSPLPHTIIMRWSEPGLSSHTEDKRIQKCLLQPSVPNPTPWENGKNNMASNTGTVFFQRLRLILDWSWGELS